MVTSLKMKEKEQFMDSNKEGSEFLLPLMLLQEV